MGHMQLSSVTQSEIRVTLELAFQLANRATDDTLDIRQTLLDDGFSRCHRIVGVDPSGR